MIELKGHTRPVLALTFTPDGTHLASASADRTARFWDLATGKSRRVGGEQKDWVAAIDCTRDGRFIAAGTHDRRVILWDVEERKQHKRPVELSGCIRALAVGPGHSFEFACGAANIIETWPNPGWWSFFEVKPKLGLVFALRFSPDGSLLAVGDDSESIKLIDFYEFTVCRELKHGDRFGCRSLAFSPDGKYLFAALGRGVPRWDLGRKPGRNATEYTGHSDIVSSVSVSPDGRSLLSGGFDGTVRLWDVQAVKERAALNWNLGKLFDVAFAPDGMRAAVCGAKPTIIVWDVED
jgi:WD40 repeat protein